MRRNIRLIDAPKECRKGKGKGDVVGWSKGNFGGWKGYSKGKGDHSKGQGKGMQGVNVVESVEEDWWGNSWWPRHDNDDDLVWINAVESNVVDGKGCRAWFECLRHAATNTAAGMLENTLAFSAKL